MFGLFVTRTRCMKGWPLVYTTYHQELEEPYRHADWCVVLRIPRRRGLVLGRYTSSWPNEDAAHAAAIGARPTPEFWLLSDEDVEEPDDGSFGAMVAVG